MTDASILDLEFDDSKFQEFFNKFEKHKESAGKLPGVWASMTKGEEKSLSVLGLIAEQLGVINASILAGTQATEKMGTAQEKFLKASQTSNLSVERGAMHALSFSRSLAEGAMSMLKIGSLAGAVSGLLGAGSLWGIDRLAAAAGGARRSAMGLGVSSGQQQAFGINFGRTLDNPSGMLETVANMQADPRQTWPFLSLGIKDYQDKNPAELAPEILDAIRTRAKATDPHKLGALADVYGWTKFESLDEIRRSVATPDDEWRGQQQQNKADQRAFDLDPATQRAWQDLTAQLNRAGQTIENTFIKGLVPLAEPLSHLSASVSQVVASFVKAADDGHWIDTLADGISSFAKFIGSPEFKDDVNGFVDGVGKLAKSLNKWVGGAQAVEDYTQSGWSFKDSLLYKGLASLGNGIVSTLGDMNPISPAQAGGIPNAAWAPGVRRIGADGLTSGAALADRSAQAWGNRSAGAQGAGGNPELEKTAHDFLRVHGHSEAETAGIMAAIGKESGWRTNAVSSDGGHGLFQWTGSREKEFERIIGIAADKATLLQQLGYFEYERTHEEKAAWGRMKGTPDNAPDQYSAFRKNIERPNKGDRQRDEASGRAAAQRYAVAALQSPAPVTVHLAVDNRTGSSISTLGAMAATPG